MTLLIGIYCADGVVVAADQQATLGTQNRPTVGSSITKILPIKNDSALFAFSGFTGLGQQIGAEVERVLDLTATYFTQVSTIQPTVNAMISGFAQRDNLLAQLGIYPDGRQEAICHSLVAARFGDGMRLFEITPTGACDAVNSLQWTSIGSGKQNADPIMAFLWDIYWRDRPPKLEEAVMTAYWAVSATIDSKAPGVGFATDVFVLDSRHGDTPVARHVSQQELMDDSDSFKK